MFRRACVGLPRAAVRPFATTMVSSTPMEDAIRAKITATLQPSHLEIHNDSHEHAHHKAMRGATSRETHFRLVVVSHAFRGRAQPARHRSVYALLKDEMAADGGIHALQLRTLTPEEEEEEEKRQGAAGKGKGEAAEAEAQS